MRTFVWLLLAAGPFNALAFSKADIEKAQVMGNWAVIRSVDPMDDKVTCTAIYKGDVAIQMTTRGLYVRVIGGVEGVKLRFGDQPAQEIRPATTMEKRVGIVILEPSDVATFVEQGRVRMQVVKVLRGMHFEDIDAAGAREVLDHMSRGCPAGRS